MRGKLSYWRALVYLFIQLSIYLFILLFIQLFMN